MNTKSAPQEDIPSCWAMKFKITDILRDRIQWDNDWERILKSVHSGEVYRVMSMMWQEIGDDEPSIIYWLRGDIHDIQQTIVNAQQTLFAGVDLGAIWFFLCEAERKTHMLQGLEGACKAAAWGQDARALCPEITVSDLLTDDGKPFLNLVAQYITMKRASQNDFFLFPNTGWDHAMEDFTKPLLEKEAFAYECLTLNRNEFIAYFLLYALESIASGLFRSRRMKSIISAVKSLSGRVQVGGVKVQGNTSVVRCENCSHLPDDVEFLVCGRCKTKLDVSLYYCSRKCQKADWPRHKADCGKQEVSRLLVDPAGDSSRGSRHLDLIRDNSVSFDVSPEKTPHHRSPALQLQFAMIERDQDADYFLFNSVHQPIRFVISDSWTKMGFRLLRQDSSANKQGVEALAMAEYMVKVMGRMPGFTREIILKQLSAEYGDDTEGKLVEFERKNVEKGAGFTFLEEMSRNMMAIAPIICKS